MYKLSQHISLHAIFLLFVLQLSVCVRIGLKNVKEKSCNRTRTILSDSWGQITDGPGDYPKESHCEWLIKASSDEHYIVLNITSMDTECSYDHLYVYDGATYNSTLLAVFSGKFSPSTVMAESGAMLILLYSDTNYMRAGFQADYYITECPFNCTQSGQCIDHICYCNDRYSGIGCEIELCPKNCGVSEGKGMCVEVADQPSFCMCNEGYVGDSCSLQTGSLKGDSWHWIHRGGDVFTPRTSQSTVYIPSLDKMYIFGGYNLNDIFDDLFVYSFLEGTWINLKKGTQERSNALRRRGMSSPRRIEILPPFQTYFESGDSGNWHKENIDFPIPNLSIAVSDNKTVILKPRKSAFVAGNFRMTRMIRPSEEQQTSFKNINSIWPAARFGHCAEYFKENFLIYGGKLSKGRLSSEFWLFNTSSLQWSLISGSNSLTENEVNSPPPLMFCTLTLVDEWLYLFGGNHAHGEFSNLMYRISPLYGWIWEKVETYGGNNLKARVVGHSTVFHPATRSLYIYGGIRVNIARFSKLSEQMLAFNVDKHFWSEIHYPKGSADTQYFPAPLERAFHTSLIAGNYMVVYGGYMHKHKEEEACYDYKIYLFHLGCHVWLSPELLPSQASGAESKVLGIYGHGAFLRHQNSLIVVGGFHGTVTNRVMAYVLPSSIIVAEGSNFNRDAACREHLTQSLCVSNLECGWCATDSTCYDRSKSANCTTNLQTLTCPGLCPTLFSCQPCVIQGDGNLCGWCMRARACQPRVSTVIGQRSCGGPHNQQGWWGTEEQLITTPDDCTVKDIPPGLTFLEFRSPVSYSHPDAVSIVSDISKDLRRTGDSREPQELQAGSASEFRLKGFVHPLYMEYLSLNKLYQGMEPIQLFLEGYKLNATLWLSSDDSSENLQEIATIITGKKHRSEAVHINGEPLIPTLSTRQLMQLDIIPHQVEANSSFNLSLSYSLGSSHPSPLLAQHLEPYGIGGNSCFNHSSCLSCLSDSLCGWCSTSRKCIPRNHSSCSHSQFPIVDTSLCAQCEDYIYCPHCINVGECEWLPEKAHCTRKGRYPKAVQEYQNCPIPCHMRQTCTACLGKPGLCAWCEATKECFLFSLYTSMYQYGACRVWIDEDHTNVTALQLSGKLPMSPGQNEDIADESSLVNQELDECLVCERFSFCSHCLEALGCGWCFNEFNPTIGRCTSGDFTKSHKGTCDELMMDILDAAERNASIVFNSNNRETKWTYSTCPDVDECLLQLHDCHPNATCINTDGSFNCSCPKGFKGNGRTSCERTCYETCVHGVCSGSPDFECVCNLGWTGTDCSTNCGCNNHSTCPTIGICNHCQEETTGPFCQYCRPGSYGNATTIGCKRCECNGHWDESKGKCDQTTGQCFCIHNTFGHSCNKCLPGFYGDPRNNGRCYQKCTARGIITNATQGYFGSQTVGEDASDTCLWILSAHDTINPQPQMLLGTHILQVTIEDIEIHCQEGALYIYEGLPDFVSVRPAWDRQNLAGSYCKDHASYPVTVQSISGIMTVFYEKRSKGQGFSASYEVIHCPENPGRNRNCLTVKPSCNEGWRGVKCEVPVCPNKCFENEGKGRCDAIYGRCVCKHSYVGEDCSIDRKDHLVVLQELFNPMKISSSLSHLQTVLPRFGHSLVVDHQGSLWIFGGYSLSRGPLNDIQQFDTRNKSWVQVTVNVHPGALPPSQRYFHASAYVVSYNEMFVYGGMNKTHFLRDFWKFNIATESWSLLPVIENLPGLGGHTLTCRGDSSPQSLILIGGVSSEYGLLSDVWEFDLLRFSWQKVISKGAKPIGIYGHSTVYHEPTSSFYVYGGFIYEENSLSLNSFLYVFDYASKRWSVLPPDGKINHNPASRPKPRAFHSSVSTEEYLVLIGGYISDRLNSNQGLMVYSYKCNMWIPLNNHFITVVGYELSSPLIGVSAAMYESSIYLIGGFAGTASGSVIEITIPEDLCTLNANKTQCKDVIGCANCVVYDSSGTNTSYCYSNTKAEPKSCLKPHGRLTSIKGIQCDSSLFEDRECYQYKTCTECLAYWPAQKESKQKCQWCLTCSNGKCIPKQGSCSEETSCPSLYAWNQEGAPQTTDINKCPELLCASSDCEKCLELGMCSWVQQREKSEAKDISINRPSRSKVCISQSMYNHSSSEQEWVSQTVCPKRCHFYRTCKACLEADAMEGGSLNCFWSPSLRKCISPTAVALQCLGGTCRHLLKVAEQCPPPCTSYTHCSQCLAQANCGWCTVDSEIGGLGLCTEGRLDGPWRGKCQDLHYDSITKDQTLMALHSLNSAKLIDEIKSGFRLVQWHYDNCPPENECQNRHHTCNIIKEVCEDTEEGFKCKCASGYNMSDEGVCKPVCSQGCQFGTCVRPNDCTCNFGFVGIDCSIKCQCNGHSNCDGPDKLNSCIKCHNNTMGPQCQRCDYNYVGNPQINDRCKSCQEYCHGHTTVCTAKEAISAQNISINVDVVELEQANSFIDEGPLADAICQHCGNNTEGPRCSTCILGYFRGTTNRSAPCRPCQCNGHGSQCDREWGSNCDCKNNTETPCNDRMRGGIPGKEKDKDCWKRQCSKCKEAYFGNPINGHQCYRQMTLENEYCLDPHTQNDCHSSPSPLSKGKAIFFAVQPKFNNVDIRLFLDISEGGVDVYITTFAEGFTVAVNNVTWDHRVETDTAFPIVEEETPLPLPSEKAKLLSPRYDLIGASSYLTKMSAERFLANRSSNIRLAPQYRLHSVDAVGFKTYFTLYDSNHFLVVKNLTDRLVVTLPKQNHNLSEAKFYVVLFGVGDSVNADSSGAIYFRQDQPRIDLFVFFSVFFSCFFLFLAVCVVVWKVKQGVDQRRARRRHVVEMLHMAKRPFASITLILQNDRSSASNPESVAAEQMVWSPARRKRGQKKERTLERFEVGPVAVEPTDDGVAAILTTVVQMPGVSIGGSSLQKAIDSPSQRLALGSTLCLVSRIYPPTSRPFHLRRRTSHLST